MGNSHRYITIRGEPHFQDLLASRRTSLKKLDKERLQSQDIPESDKDLQDTFACIQQHRVISLQGRWGISKMLIYISNVNFPQLSCLNLCSSGILNVEVLPRVHMPQLQELWLGSNIHIVGYNKICTLKPLRKAAFPQLDTLQIRGNNKLKEFSQIQQTSFPFMRHIIVERNSRTGSQDLSCLLKLRVNDISTLSVFLKARIHQPRIRKQLKAKYPTITIQSHER